MKILILLLALTSNIQAKTIGKVLFVKGDVFLSSKTKEQKRLYKHSKLNSNETIVTKDKSLAIIGFGPYFQSKIKVAANSEFQLSETVSKLQGPLPVKNYNVFLRAGNVLINFLKSKTKSLSVQTKTAALGVRGTTFFADLSENNVTCMTVKKGAVAVSSSQSEGEVVVEKGNGTLTNHEGKVIEPREFEWEKEVNWNLNPATGNLMHSKNLRASLAASYEKYKKEQEAKLKAYRKRIIDQKKMIDRTIEKQKKLMFGRP